MKNSYTIIGIITVLGFIAYTWWAAWFLRAGAQGPNTWALTPIVVTGTVIALICVGLLSRVFEDMP